MKFRHDFFSVVAKLVSLFTADTDGIDPRVFGTVSNKLGDKLAAKTLSTQIFFDPNRKDVAFMVASLEEDMPNHCIIVDKHNPVVLKECKHNLHYGVMQTAPEARLTLELAFRVRISYAFQRVIAHCACCIWSKKSPVFHFVLPCANLLY